MTDRELLELAAKAAGLRSHRYCEPWKAMAQYTLSDGYFGATWNPLTDDGDALRLAVKLGICPSADETAASAMVSLDEVSWCDLKEVGNDPCAATRRAIVRAAAAIGRTM